MFRFRVAELFGESFYGHAFVATRTRARTESWTITDYMLQNTLQAPESERITRLALTTLKLNWLTARDILLEGAR